MHALCGTIEGEEAIYTMLTWPGGGFSLDEGILPHKKSVTSTWEQLLFEGARRADAGMLRTPKAGPTITTAEPMTIRMYDSQPKVTITRPDLPESTYNLEQEYTHVGRSQGNEICLPYPSISNRHCIIIHSGSDIVVRDLNSSNGTYVNGEIISEVVLRPGDCIQCGVVFMKFEPGVKRPKLNAPEPTGPTLQKPMGQLKTVADTGTIYYQTVRMPNAPVRPKTAGAKVKEDSAFVKGESAISYETIAQPEEKKDYRMWYIIGGVVIFALLIVLAYCFVGHPHPAH